MAEPASAEKAEIVAASIIMGLFLQFSGVAEESDLGELRIFPLKILKKEVDRRVRQDRLRMAARIWPARHHPHGSRH